MFYFCKVMMLIIITYVCVSRGKKCLFFRNFDVLCFLETPVLRFALLPYYRRESLNLDIKKLQMKYNNLKQLWRKLRDKKKNSSCLDGAQDLTWFQILNPVLSDTNEGMDGICSNSASTLLSDFFSARRRRE